MADYEVGYRRPPKHSRFKPGVPGNRNGRPRKQKPDGVNEVINKTINASIEYPEHGRTRTATRSEVGWKRLVDDAVRGSLTAITTVLKILTSSARPSSSGIETVEVSNWRQDYPGQTAEQKTEEYAAISQAISAKLPR